MSTVSELKSLAKERGIRGYTTMRKSELLMSLSKTGPIATPKDPLAELEASMAGLTVSNVKMPQTPKSVGVRMPELRSEAKALGIKGYIKMRKTELEKAIMEAKQAEAEKRKKLGSPEKPAPRERSAESITKKGSDESVNEFANRLADYTNKQLQRKSKLSAELLDKTIFRIRRSLIEAILEENEELASSYRGENADEFEERRITPAEDIVFRRVVRDFLRSKGTFWFNITWEQFAKDLLKFFKRNIDEIEIPELLPLGVEVIRSSKYKKPKRKRLV